MFSTICLQILRLSTGKGMIVLALVLLPFPVSIPLALWLSREERLDDAHSARPKRSLLRTQGTRLVFLRWDGEFRRSSSKVQGKLCRKSLQALRNEGQGKEAFTWTWIFVHRHGQL